MGSNNSINNEDIVSICDYIEKEKAEGKRIVLTSGCFDLLHMGHVKYLEEAKCYGDLLIVGVNSDTSIKRIKGLHRPILDESQRLYIVDSLKFVDKTFLFDSVSLEDEIIRIKPDVFVIGEESVELYPNEIEAARKIGSMIHIISRDPKYSSSSIIMRIRG